MMPKVNSDYMSRPGIYGDNSEVAAVSKVYGICLKVLVGPMNEEHGDRFILQLRKDVIRYHHFAL